jgi:NTP pyrophosphatase (non-canonical NTP hydrolase)
MEIANLQKEIFKNKQNRNFNTTDVGKEIILMTEELGELAKAYKNSDKKPAKEISNKEEILDAAGDLMVYCIGLCEMMGQDAGQLLAKIIEKNKSRKHTGHM